MSRNSPRILRRLGPIAITFALTTTACSGSTTAAKTVDAAAPTGEAAATEQPTVGLPTPPSTLAPEPTLDPVEARNAATAQLDGVPDPEVENDPSERNIVAGVNLAIADVELADIVFDTFDGGSISLVDAAEDQILGLLNAIPPIDDPIYMPGDQASWLTADDLVLGFVADDGSTWAHPHRVLNFHEIVNTTFAGQAVAITYCPLCGSGVAFDRAPNDLRHDGVLTFDNTSALYENDMVMVDEETHTYWWQVSGRGIVGNLTGTELTLLPSMTTSWSAWLESHPDTMVLSNDQGRGPRYEIDPFATYATSLDLGRTTFPTSPEAFADERLSPSTRVIGFDLGDTPAAVAVLANERTVVPIDDSEQVVLLDGRGGGGLFASVVSGQSTTFTAAEAGFVDAATQSTWNDAGRAIAGPAEGEQLEALPSRAAFWFAWVSTTAGVKNRLFTPDGER